MEGWGSDQQARTPGSIPRGCGLGGGIKQPLYSLLHYYFITIIDIIVVADGVVMSVCVIKCMCECACVRVKRGGRGGGWRSGTSRYS